MVDFDPMSQAFLDDPDAVFAHYRGIADAYRHEEAWPAPVVSVLGYAEVKAAFRDYGMYSSFVPEDARELELGDSISMAGENPPVHTRLRNVVNRSFTGRAMKDFEADVQRIVDQRFDDAIEHGEIEMVEGLAAKIAVGVIGALIGVPDEDLHLVRDWTRRQAVFNGASFWLRGDDDPNIERYTSITAEIGAEMQEYFAALYDDRKNESRSDVMSTIAASELERQEGISLAKLLVLGGNDTTMNLMNNIVVALIDHPDQDRLLRDEPDRVTSAVEETLRWAPPLRWSPRSATCDGEIGGVPVHEGEGVVLWISSANRDERVYEHPHMFDITRDTSSFLVSFGLGPHACIGGILARMEGRIFAETLLRRTSGVERTSDVMPPLPTPAFCGVSEHHVRLRAS